MNDLALVIVGAAILAVVLIYIYMEHANNPDDEATDEDSPENEAK